MNNFSNGTKNSKSSAIVITIVLCLLLAAGAVIISLMNPSSDFDFLPSLVQMGETHYTDMEYTRPDSAALIADMDKLIQMMGEGKSFTEQSRLFTTINENLVNYRTMMSLAEIKYYTDTTDEYFKTENELLQAKYVGIFDKIGELLDSIEASNFKTNYERSFFGVGYFTDWVPMDKSDKATELMEKETELITKYQDSLANAFVSYNGKDIYLSSDEFYELGDEDYSAVIALYYEKYNKELGEIYAELVKTRLYLAEELGVDYIEYAYDGLARDYTPEQAGKYIDNVILDIIPLISQYEINYDLLYEEADTVTSFYYLSLAADRMGGTISEAFNYMVKYGLYDIAYSPYKQSVSFEVFLEKYNSPFIFVSPMGTMNDFLTFAHEFGHFTDEYYNMGMGITIDNTEIVSQAMAFLAPMYSNGFNGISSDELLKLNVGSTFDMYLSSCFINKFETAAYSLSPDEVTLDKLNELAESAAREIGLNEYGIESLSASWFEIQHIYIAPMYSVGYAISNDVSFQILEEELKDPGKGGVKAFENIIDRDLDLSFEEDIKKSDFESPFDDGRTQKIAELIESIFNPNAEGGESESGTDTSADSKAA